MNKLTLALLASAAALAIAPSAMATTIPTGTGTLGTEVGSTSGSITSTGGVTTFTGTFTESVWTYNVAGDLAFEYTVVNTTPSADSIDQLATNYGGWADSALKIDGTAGDGVTGTYNGVGTIDVLFTNGLGNSNVGSGTSTSTFILFTDATAFGAGPLSLQDSGVGASPALVPAPEPSSLLLLGTGLLGLAFVAFRKAKSTGMVLSM